MNVLKFNITNTVNIYMMFICSNIGNPIGKIPLSAKGITDVTTYNHPIDICSERYLPFVETFHFAT